MRGAGEDARITDRGQTELRIEVGGGRIGEVREVDDCDAAPGAVSSGADALIIESAQISRPKRLRAIDDSVRHRGKRTALLIHRRHMSHVIHAQHGADHPGESWRDDRVGGIRIDAAVTELRDPYREGALCQRDGAAECDRVALAPRDRESLVRQPILNRGYLGV